MTELFLLSFLISFCCEDYPFPIPFPFHGLCTLVRSAPYYGMLVPMNLCIVIRICAGAAAWLSAKVALEGGNTELVIACPASSLHYRPAQLPLWLSAPSKCAHLLLQESLLTCTLSTCCNHILGRNRCAPSESHPFRHIHVLLCNAGSSCAWFSWSTSCKTRKGQAAASQKSCR